MLSLIFLKYGGYNLDLLQYQVISLLQVPGEGWCFVGGGGVNHFFFRLLVIIEYFSVIPLGHLVRFIKSLSVSAKKSLTRYLIYIAVILASGNYVNLI